MHCFKLGLPVIKLNLPFSCVFSKVCNSSVKSRTVCFSSSISLLPGIGKLGVKFSVIKKQDNERLSWIVNTLSNKNDGISKLTFYDGNIFFLFKDAKYKDTKRTIITHLLKTNRQHHGKQSPSPQKNMQRRKDLYRA